MAVTVMNQLIEGLSPLDEGQLSAADEQLLEAFVRDGDTTSLGVLIRRHGPMVWGVCQ